MCYCSKRKGQLKGHRLDRFLTYGRKDRNEGNKGELYKLKVNRVEQHLIKKNNIFYSLIDELCFKSKNVYNYGNYIIRQEFIKTSKEKEEGTRENANWIRHNELAKICKTSDCYKELGSRASQAILRKLDKNWKSFFSSIKDYNKNPSKFVSKPKMPKYLDTEKGRCELIQNNQQFKIKENYIYFSWSPLKVMNNIFKTKIPIDAKLMQIRFVPKNENYVMEVVYEIEIPEIVSKNKRIASIDLGINNLLTITTNCGIEPIVINGKPLKSINQYYNKEKAKIQTHLKTRYNKDWSNKIQKLTIKRNNKVKDYIHKTTATIINFCIENKIDTLVCGYNSGWKQESNMGKRNNQKFINIPHATIIQQLTYKCENTGIIFKTTEEAYTSGTSFLDGEEPVEKNYNKDRRVHRGLFVSNEGININADVNGSYQIMKKVFPEAIKHTTHIGLHPTIINLT